MAVGLAIVLNGTVWGRHLFAVGGNQAAARLTGVPVTRVKIQAYVFSAACASIASLLSLAWQGSAINALGQGYELKVIAGTVVGGADLMGGIGGAYGAVVGSAFLEVIRNSLLMAGVDYNYQGIFDGGFIILAVLLSQIRRRQKN
jgi:ribose transport system permease protein